MIEVNALDIARVLVERHEGCRLSVYRDSGGLPTIGVGFTTWGGEKVTMQTPAISQQACDIELERLLQVTCTTVAAYCARPITAHQQGALTCLAYDIGLGALRSSTLLNLFNKGRDVAAANQFLVWDRIRGAVCFGLQQRRADERRVFLGGEP